MTKSNFFKRLKKCDHPWSNFLYARAVAMDWLRQNMKTDEEKEKAYSIIARNMSMDEIQVQLILMQWDDEVKNETANKKEVSQEKTSS